MEEKTEIRWFFPVRTALSAGLDLWVCGGTNVTGNRCERKYSRHSNEVSLSTMRLGRGWEWAVKKAKGGVGRGTESTRDVGGKGSVF